MRDGSPQGLGKGNGHPAVFIRRLKQEVLPQLPAKVREQHVLNLPAAGMVAARTAWKELRQQFKELDAVLKAAGSSAQADREARAAEREVQQSIMQAWVALSKEKAEAAAKHAVAMVEEEGKTKLLCFAHHAGAPTPAAAPPACGCVRACRCWSCTGPSALHLCPALRLPECPGGGGQEKQHRVHSHRRLHAEQVRSP